MGPGEVALGLGQPVTAIPSDHSLAPSFAKCQGPNPMGPLALLSGCFWVGNQGMGALGRGVGLKT